MVNADGLNILAETLCQLYRSAQARFVTFDLNIRELTKRGRRRLRGLHLKIQVRVIHIKRSYFMSFRVKNV